MTATQNQKPNSARPRLCSKAIVGTTIWLMTAVHTFGQLPTGRLNSVFPAGGQSGTNFTARITGGADLDETKEFRFSHPGIRAVPTTDGIEGSSSFHVSIDPSVPRGVYEFRAGGIFGLSNPRLFMVGTLKESREAEPNDIRTQSNEIAINETANGQVVASGDADWFRFRGKSSQRILIECDARRLDSPMTPRVELFAENGRRLARARGNQSSAAMIDVALPRTGTYMVKVSDQSFAGSSDHVYRLSVHDQPHIDFVLPTAVQAGQRSTVTVYGRNLPGGQSADIAVAGRPLQMLTTEVVAPTNPHVLDSAEPVMSPQAGLDGFSWRLPNSNPVLLQFAAASPSMEVEPNDTAPQVISTPADITAQFQSKGDIDRFEFTASKGQAYVIEVIGQRRIPTLDPWFILEQVQIDKPGKETTKRLTTQDDTATNIGGNDFWTANADPQFRFTAPATGRYRLSVRDRYNESRGDPSLVYRLVVRPARPDFRLIVLTAKPAAAAGQPVDQGGFAIRSGGNAGVDVMIIRRDGFAKPVRIRAENLPPGVRCDDVWLDKNQSRTKLVLTASTGSPIGSQPIRIVGETVGSSPVARIARTATVVRRTPGASQSRLANDAVLSVLPHTPPLQLQSEINEITANQSQQILVPLKLAKRNGFDANVNVTFTGQPANVEAENKPIAKGQNEGLFRIFLKNNTPPGTYTIIPRGTAAVPFVRNVGLLERAATAHAPFVAKAQAATKAVADAKTMAGSKQTALTNLKKQSETFSQQLTAARLTIAESQKAMKTSESQLEQTKALLTNQTRIRTIRNSVAKSLQTAATAIANDNTLAADVRAARELVSSADKAIIETKDKITTAQKLIAALGEKVRTASNTVKSLEPRVKEASMKIQLAEAQVQTAMAALKASEEQLAQANKEKTEADKTLKAIQDKNKPQNINVYEPSTPIVIHVKKSPLAIAATVPNGGNIKRGQSLEVAIKLNRKGFQGPVRVLFHCPASDDVHASPIVIAGNTISGSLQLKTKPDATKSILTNCVIRAEFEQGHAFKVDAPIKIQVQE